jgi:hypothetical protein
MVRRPRGALALLVATLLATAAPAATQAADATTPAVSTTADTPLNKNLLRNPGFDATFTDGEVPSWETEGAVHVERFGDRAWPYPAYGRKYGGGKQYLACGGKSGLVRQSVPFVGFTDPQHPLKAHLIVDFGGLKGHSIRVTLLASGPKGQRAGQRLKPLTITNHYKRVVAWVVLPEGTDRLTATVELVGTDDGSRCRMVADTTKLEVFRP